MRANRPEQLTRRLGLKSFFLRPTKLLLPALFLLVGFILYQLFFGQLWTITNITCLLDDQACPNEVTSQLDYLKGQKLITFKAASVKEKMLKTNPYIQDIKFQIFYPDKINLRLVSKQDLVKIDLIKVDFVITPTPTLTPTPRIDLDLEELSSTPSSQTVSTPHSFLKYLPFLENKPFDQLLLSTTGELLPVLNTNVQHFATILVKDNLPNSTILKNFYQLYHELYFSNLRSTVFAIDSYAGVKLANNTLVVFSLEKDPRVSAASLQQILSESTIDTQDSIIDLRFANPVITKITLEN